MDRREERLGKSYTQSWLDFFRRGQVLYFQTQDGDYTGVLAQIKTVDWHAKQRKLKELEPGQAKLGKQHAQSRDGLGDKGSKQTQAEQAQYMCEKRKRQ
eukprot:12192350-Heterocapsa_arctica.AAC.1